MKKFTCTLLLTLAGWHLTYAADATRKSAAPDAPAPATAAIASDAPAAFELKTKSSFATENSSRNPFWPIAWKPTVKVSTSPSGAAAPAAPEISPSAFLVSSIMTGQGSRFAIINGKPMQEGQVFGLQFGTQVYQITVKGIEDGAVILQRGAQQFSVPLRRQ